LTAFPVILKIVYRVQIRQLVFAVKLAIPQLIMDNRAHNACSHAQFVPKLISRCVLGVFQDNLCQELIVCHVMLAVNNVPEVLIHALVAPQVIILE